MVDKALQNKLMDGKKITTGRFLTVCLLTVVVFSILVKLGFWQLARAQEKRAIESEIAQRANRSAVSLGALTELEVVQPTGIRVTLSATPVTKRYLLLDNQSHQGEVGYLALQLTKTSSDQFILLERGFVVAPNTRDVLPKVDWLQQPFTVEGRLYKRSANPLSHDLYMESGVPNRIQNLNITQLKEAWQVEIEPYVLQPDVKASQMANWQYAQPWQPVSLSPDKHTGYAVQWFSMAGVLVLINIVLLMRIVRNQ